MLHCKFLEIKAVKTKPATSANIDRFEYLHCYLRSETNMLYYRRPNFMQLARGQGRSDGG